MSLRTTTKAIWAKDGRVIAPRTKLDIVAWPGGGWRVAFLVDDRGQMVKLAEHDVECHTAPE